MTKDLPTELGEAGNGFGLETDWQQYVAVQSQATVVTADRLQELTSRRRLKAYEVDSLLVKLTRGAEGFTDVMAVMRSQHVSNDLVSAVVSLNTAWLHMIDLVQQHRDLAEPSTNQDI